MVLNIVKLSIVSRITGISGSDHWSLWHQSSHTRGHLSFLSPRAFLGLRHKLQWVPPITPVPCAGGSYRCVVSSFDTVDVDLTCKSFHRTSFPAVKKGILQKL